MPLPAELSEAQQVLARMMSAHYGQRVEAASLRLIASGASGRCMMRPPGDAGSPLQARALGIYWTAARADNASFVPAARGLARAGVRVPQVLAEANLGHGCGACLVSDMGDADLLSLREAPWEARLGAYRLAMGELCRFHGVHPDWPLQPPFDAALYRWEQAYFAEHLIGRHLGGDARAFLAHPALAQVAEWLAALPRRPIHRDCQSQNIMLHDGRACFIDFQGMREGRPEYDVASLVLDPYMNFSAEQQAELLCEWEYASGAPLDPAIFAACALQRLMQALGAFANIGHNQQRRWYLDLIPVGLESLRRVARQARLLDPTAPLATCLLNAV